MLFRKPERRISQMRWHAPCKRLANPIDRHSKRCTLYKVMQMHSQSRLTAQATADIRPKFKT
jgi:hypothetical protein